MATKQGHIDVVECLYEKGANMNIMNLEGVRNYDISHSPMWKSNSFSAFF